jgi:hypothetical protein
LPGDLPDQCGAVEQRARGHVEELEPEVAVGLLVELLEGERVLEADPPGRGGLDEALVADVSGHDGSSHRGRAMA